MDGERPVDVALVRRSYEPTLVPVLTVADDAATRRDWHSQVSAHTA